MKKTLGKFVVSPTQKLSVGDLKKLKGGGDGFATGVKIPTN